MTLQEFLFPQEAIKYQSQRQIRYGGQDYVLYITNRRVIGHKIKGFVFKKDKVFSVALEEISYLKYDEKGLVHKKGVLAIETLDQKMRFEFEGGIEDVKVVWQEMQKQLGYVEPLGAPTAYSENSHRAPVRILDERLSKGEITIEQYTELKKTLEK
ncbi:hypothetical protein [Candidatus Nitrososphaera sp. FF02]|uniref:hypothetical protein n=1 Tax=Candidatus Nitrososphaera sp. FF02 TaxID=3398226 RepID=UPI0039E9E56A